MIYSASFNDFLNTIDKVKYHTELIALNDYSKTGELIKRGVGNTSGNPLQEIKYAYNVRGWLKEINDPTLSLGEDLFGFKINYNTVSHTGTKLYNGNIAETEWKTKNDNQLRWYRYGYDDLNRITSATANSSNYNVSGITYDKNGNIQSLTRRGAINSSATSFGNMDVLSYAYNSYSNRLQRVNDSGNNTYGFKDSSSATTQYTYDANGNMITDANKGITGISYNHLNLPNNIDIGNGTIDYIYGATGAKQRKVAAGTTTDYAGNYIYKNGSLKFFGHPEGYVEYENGDFNYVYNYKDQVNNVRLSYSDTNGDDSIDPDTEILHERNYYPFGLLHRGYNNVINGTVNNKEQYQGQEYTEDLGLNIHEWKYRFSDPAIGRFWQIDPLATEYSYQSPYNFSENRVIDAFELEGLEKVSIHTRAFAPFNSFGGGFSGDGANRGFTTSQNVTSRVKQAVNIDFDQSSPVVSGGTQTSDPTHHSFLGTDTAPDRNVLKNVQIGQTSTGAKQVSFQSEIEGANPLTLKGLTPNIDIDGIFSISSNQETGVMNISANITGDNFPSAESFISDSAGNSVFIGVSAFQGNPASSLPGEGGHTDLQIDFNTDGVFQNVIYNGQQYNIQDYNNLFETQNPNGN